jgi:carbamoyltransferase
MKILGISHDVLICSACVMVDGTIVSAMAEERLDRVKQSRVFPRRAIQACLAASGLAMSDINEIAIGWNPAIESETTPSSQLGSRRWRTEHWLQVPGQLMQLAGEKATIETTIRNLYHGAPPATFVNHYWAHMGMAYALGPFDDAAILILDGRGEKDTVLLAHGTGTQIKVLSQTRFPHSLGLFYSAITQFLGHRPDSDEWKVMALASYAGGDNEYTPLLRGMVSVTPEGRLELDLSWFEFYNFWDNRMYSDRMVEALGAPRAKGSAYSERDMQIAAAMQRVFEDTAAELLRVLHKLTGSANVAVGGGCFMNSVFNGKITAVSPFANCHIGFAPDDSGTSLGAAAWLHAERTGTKPNPPASAYLGLAYEEERIARTVAGFKLPNARREADVCATAAADLAAGKILGWFQGRSEFGQRALGNRSILADPRRAEMKDAVNAAVKFREGFRPFAPAILADKTTEFFETDKNGDVPYMEKVFQFRAGKRNAVPAVVHADGSGRLQTVEERHNPRFYGLIRQFGDLTGIPIVLNTSFNLNGEPVVETPEDAIRTFYACGLDVLYLGDWRIAKS